MARLQPGDPAPEFTLPDADGTPVSLAGLSGRKVIIYFYPAAMTPGLLSDTSKSTLEASGHVAKLRRDLGLE